MHHLAPPSVRLFVCGAAERGDDGAALSAVATLLPSLPAHLLERIEVRRCGQLRPEDMVDVPEGELAVVVDAAVGVAPGHVVALPIRSLVVEAGMPAPRSLQASGLDGTLCQAAAARPGGLPEGTFIGIGGRRYGYGRPLSRSVRLGMDAFQAAIADELARLAQLPGATRA